MFFVTDRLVYLPKKIFRSKFEIVKKSVTLLFIYQVDKNKSKYIIWKSVTGLREI